MNKRLAAALLSLGIASQASAGLLFHDDFDYTPGDKLAPLNDTIATPNPGKHNIPYNVDWRYTGAGGATNNAPGLASGSLTYPDLGPSTGNSVAFDTTQLGSTRIQVTPSAISSGTVYWSALLRVNDVNGLNAVNGMLLGGFNNATGAGTNPTVVGAGLRIRQAGDADHYQIGTGMNSGTGTGVNGANVQYDSTLRAEGDTVLVIGSYEFIPGATNDIARMWINPSAADLGAASPPPALLTSAPGSTIADSFVSLISYNLRNVNTVGAPNVQLDELRVADDWAGVTMIPEPASIGLLGLGAAGLLGRRRRR